MGRPSRPSPEVRARAVRMVEEHREAQASEWTVLQSVAPKLGCTTETLRIKEPFDRPRQAGVGLLASAKHNAKQEAKGRELSDCAETLSPPRCKNSVR